MNAAYTDYQKHYTLDARFIVEPERMGVGEHAIEKRRIQAIVREARSERTSRALDVGCGAGWLAEELARQGPRVYALDLSRGGVQGARRRFGLPAGFLVGDAYQLPFCTSSFELVVLSEVLEHLQEPSRALLEVHRVLRSQGRVIISVPYREKIRWYLCIHCNQPTPANAHLHSFDIQALSDLVHAGGFRVARTRRLSSKMLETLGLTRLTRSLPYFIWRGVDSLLSAVSDKSHFLCLVCRK